MTGTYTELLGPGKLSINKGGWWIEYYWPGPDARYKGTFFTIEGKEIPDYIFAWEKNFLDYQSLVDTVPKGGRFEKPGLNGMIIRVGGYWSGVSLQSYHFQVRTKGELDQVIRDYRYAESRAQKIREALFS